MTQSAVQFVPSPSKYLSSSELDSALRRPLLDRASGNRTPSARVLAALTKGFALGCSPSAVRYSARRVTAATDPVRAVIDSDRSWSVLALLARKFVDGQTAPSSGVSSARLSVARRLVGHVLAPAQRVAVWVAATGADVKAGRSREVGEMIVGTRPVVSARGQVSARACLAVLASQSLLDGKDFDSSIASMAWLATELNQTEKNAKLTTRRVERLGWVSRLNSTSKGAARWRLKPLTPEEDEIAWVHSATITAIASGHYADDPLAAVLTSVRHSAWAYSEELGLSAWLAVVSGLAAVPPQDLGLGARSAKALRHRVTELLPAIATQPLTPQLDELAENTLAVFIKDDRELAHDELVAARQTERDEFTARRKAERVDEKYCEREIIKPALKVLNGFPTGEWDREIINRWMASDDRGWIGAYAYFRGPGKIHDASLVPTVRKKITWLMTNKGVTEEETAAWITDQLVPSPDTKWSALIS